MKYALLPGAINRAAVLAAVLQDIAALSALRGWAIEVKRYVKPKSNKQTSALFGLAYRILEEQTGQPVNDWHEYALGEHFGWVEQNYFGKKRLRPARTLTTGYDGEDDEISAEGCAGLFDFVQRRAAMNGITIPDPDPQWRQRRKAKAGEFEEPQVKAA